MGNKLMRTESFSLGRELEKNHNGRKKFRLVFNASRKVYTVRFITNLEMINYGANFHDWSKFLVVER